VPSPRGIGFMFSHGALLNFLKINKLKFIVRSHQLVEKGFNWNGRTLTVWSAPNYCYSCNNSASLFCESDEYFLVKYEKCENQHVPTEKIKF
jgi:hypothetical protein